MNNVGQLSFPQRDVRKPNPRFEISAIELDNPLQRASRMPRITAFKEALANQRQ